MNDFGDIMPRRIISITTFLVFLFCCGSPLFAAENKTSATLVLLPFEAGSAGKYTYLKDSLRTMLATRLAANDGIRVLDSALSPKDLSEIKTGKKQAPSQGLFNRLHADYIVAGALGSHGEGLSLQLTLYPASAAGKIQTISVSAEKEDQILASVDRLAADVGSRVSMPSMSSSIAAATPEAAPKAQESGTVDQMAAFRTPNPERLYKTGIYAGGRIVGAENSGMPVSSEGVKKSAPLSMKMVGMAIGDLEGNGEQDIVVAADEELRLYHYNQGRFLQIAKLKISPRLKIHAINLADVDKSGKSKIYISATEERTASSLILAWDKEQGLQTLHKNIPWYIRPMEIPGQGLVLVGQQKGTDDNVIIFPGLYELTFTKGSNIPKQGKQVPVPKSVNLFDFTFADLNGDGKFETIVIDKDEKLAVYDQANTLLWISQENFGGSPNYFGKDTMNATPETDRVFVPTRIIAVDMNHDNKQEILVGRNRRSSYTFFRNIRTYDDGFVSCLSWTGSVMRELWHTNTLGGIVADYSLLQAQDGSRQKAGPSQSDEPAKKNSLTFIIGQVPETAVYNVLLSGSPESVLYAYTVDILKKNDSAK
jgi:hypothetical protein